ncbi:MAG: helix-turn-helix transcriptional regulator [Armatimonadota bacterium]
MPSSRPSLARLLHIHHAISDGGHPSITKLASACEVDERTIKRDLKVLREEFDAPLEHSREHGGYYYTRGFAIDSLQLTEGEELALCMTMTMAGALRHTHLASRMRQVMRKLQVLLPEPTRSAFEEHGLLVSCLADPAPPESVQTAIIFNDLLRAIEDHHQVRLTYFAMSSNIEEVRTVDPYHLYYHHGLWYLHGWCHLRNQPRDFALTRMRQVELRTTTFSPPDLDAIKAKLAQRFSVMTGDPVEVVVWFDTEEARRVRERVWHPSQQIEDHPDGSCTLRMTVEGITTVVRWLLSFGRHAKPIAPPELVRQMQDEVQAMAHTLH